MKEIWNLFKNLYFLNLPKVTLYGLWGKYRISLDFLPGWGGLRCGDMEFSE